MLPVISTLLAFVAGLFRSPASLYLENLALRHQLAVYQQTVHRPRLHPTDRLFWAWLSRLWSAWQDVLAFVQPRTVIAWQRQRFRDHWRQLSQQGTPGRRRCRAGSGMSFRTAVTVMARVTPAGARVTAPSRRKRGPLTCPRAVLLRSA
jgi:hypothetical protein